MTSLQPAEPALAQPESGMRAVPRASSWADFEGVYREHFRFVWRSVRRLGIGGTAVDDVAQEVFLVVHRRLGDFEGRSSPKTWLYGIVRRVVSDHRRTQRRKPLDGAGSDLEAMAGMGQGPEASAEQSEKVRLLHRLLAELDDDKREVFVLTELEGLTMVEVAEVLGVNANTLASRLRAARRDFEAALERATQSGDGLAAERAEREEGVPR